MSTFLTWLPWVLFAITAWNFGWSAWEVSVLEKELNDALEQLKRLQRIEL
jgi:hypothetical protein